MQINIAATDDEEAIASEITKALEPLSFEQRQDIVWTITAHFKREMGMRCNHEGIGSPYCPTCRPRTIARLREMGVEWDQ